MSVYIHTIDYYKEDIDEVLLELFEQVDVIYAVARDKIIQAHLRGIAELCLQNKVPLIGGGILGPQEGALASLAFDPYRVGKKRADIILMIKKVSQDFQIRDY